MNEPSAIKGYTAALLSVIGFASTFVAGSVLTKELGVTPHAIAFFRFAVAGAIMAAFIPLALKKGVEKPRLRRKSIVKMAILGPIGTAFMAWCVFKGCSMVSSANASMADALTPLGIFVVTLVSGQRATPLQLAGLAVGLLGSMLVIGILNGNGLMIESYTLGDFYILLSAAAWGIYTVYGRDLVARNGSVLFSSVTMVFGAAALLLCIIANDIAAQFSAFLSPTVWPSTVKGWGLCLFIALFSTLMPFWAWNYAQKHLPLSVLAMSAYFTPVFTVIIAIAFIGEKTTPLQWLGALLIAFSAITEIGRDKAGKRTK